MSDDLQPPEPGELERDIAAAVDRHARPHLKPKYAETAPRLIAAAIARHLKVANWRFVRGR